MAARRPQLGATTLRDDRGAAVVESSLVLVLLVFLLLALIQLGFALHVRNTLVASAAEGARYAANADRSPEDGAARTRELVAAALGEEYATNVTAGTEVVGGVTTVVVVIEAPLPLLGPTRSRRPPRRSRARVRGVGMTMLGCAMRTRCAGCSSSDDGSASLEFVVLGVLLLVPLAYLLITVFAVQSAAYGVSAAVARGRPRVRPGAGRRRSRLHRAFAAASIALQDHGIELDA